MSRRETQKNWFKRDIMPIFLKLRIISDLQLVRYVTLGNVELLIGIGMVAPMLPMPNAHLRENIYNYHLYIQ